MVKVMGEAMAPTLPEGWLVLVNPGGKDRENNRIYLVRSGGQGTVIARRVKKGCHDGGQVMVADNATLNDQVVAAGRGCAGGTGLDGAMPPRQSRRGRRQSVGNTSGRPASRSGTVPVTFIGPIRKLLAKFPGKACCPKRVTVRRLQRGRAGQTLGLPLEGNSPSSSSPGPPSNHRREKKEKTPGATGRRTPRKRNTGQLRACFLA